MRTLVGLVATLALTTVTATSASASTEVLLLMKDKRGDVKIFKSKKISTTKKKSIDIESASLTKLSSGKYRYKVRIKKAYHSKKWEQVISFSSYPIDDMSLGSGTSVGFDTSARTTKAGNERTSSFCSVKVHRKGRTFWVDVPRKCAPYSGDAVSVGTITAHYGKTFSGFYSSDELTLGVLNVPSR